MKNETYLETTIESWSQINELDDYFFSPFVFRGQSDSTWNLKSSIERKSRDFGRTVAITEFNTEEKWMLHEFMRKYHLYSTINIDKNDKFEWLAIMQHYGLNNARFPQALKVDQEFQTRLVFLSSFNKQNQSGTKFKITFEPLNDGKPYCVVELLYTWVDEK